MLGNLLRAPSLAAGNTMVRAISGVVVVVCIAIGVVALLWRDYSGTVYVDGKHNLSYAHVEHRRLGGFIGGAIYPCFNADGAENWTGSIGEGTVSVNGKPDSFPRGKQLCIISRHGQVTFHEIVDTHFESDQYTRYARPNVTAMKASGFWDSTVSPALGPRPGRTQKPDGDGRPRPDTTADGP